MNLDWQSLTALAVVLLAAVLLLRRMLRPKRGGCGGGCGCRVPRQPKQK